MRVTIEHCSCIGFGFAWNWERNKRAGCASNGTQYSWRSSCCSWKGPDFSVLWQISAKIEYGHYLASIWKVIFVKINPVKRLLKLLQKKILHQLPLDYLFKMDFNWKKSFRMQQTLIMEPLLRKLISQMLKNAQQQSMVGLQKIPRIWFKNYFPPVILVSKY